MNYKKKNKTTIKIKSPVEENNDKIVDAICNKILDRLAELVAQRLMQEYKIINPKIYIDDEYISPK